MQKNFHIRCSFGSQISTIKLLKLKEALSLELKTLILYTIKDVLWDVVCWTPHLVGVTVLCSKMFGPDATLTVILFTQIYKWVSVE